MPDPYVYPGTTVLINKLGIRDAAILRAFEIEATTQRIAEGIPNVALTVDGYRELHRHIFQDVYPWAGKIRVVDISKPGALFCRAERVAHELGKRFDQLAAEDNLRGLPAERFAYQAAEYLSELNAIHPFRDGNGRAQRAFLEILGAQAGHPLAIERIGPGDWLVASQQSFQSGNTDRFQQIVMTCLDDRNRDGKFDDIE